MAKYLLVYYGGKMAATPAEQKKSIDTWTKWFQSLGKAVVDMGAPTMPEKLVGADGAKKITGKLVTGYSVFEAANIDAAVKLARGSPQISADGEIAIYSIMPM